MAATISTTEAPSAGIPHATQGPDAGPIRREDPAAIEPGSAARELDAEVARLLRVQCGELAEPLLWQRPSLRREVEAIVAQLAPIRSRIALMSSWDRESRRDAGVRLAYAIVWLRLAQRRAGEYGPHLRGAGRRRLVKARG
jgi:hypothetical protein